MNCARQGGVGLIEVAVALLLVSVAVLGVARARLFTTETAFSARQLARATDLADGLLEIAAGDAAALAGYQLAQDRLLVTPPLDCRSGDCDTAAWSQWNLWQWLQALQGTSVRGSELEPLAGLLGVRACVDVAGPWVTVHLNWQWRLAHADPSPDCRMAGAQGRQQLSLRSRARGS